MRHLIALIKYQKGRTHNAAITYHEHLSQIRSSLSDWFDVIAPARGARHIALLEINYNPIRGTCFKLSKSFTTYIKP